MLSIARLRTNATNLDELQLALLEIESLVDDPKLSIEYLPMSKQFLLTRLDGGTVSIGRVMSHAAMFDDDVHGPTQWFKLRQSIEDGKNDHSTHNLAPYEGKMMPKLARALINICVGRHVGARVCDPFCGSGTVLVEAALMGHYGFGFDVNPYAVHLTRQKLSEMKQPTPGWALTHGDFSFAEAEGRYHAVVTSPPYFNAIDYVHRDQHRLANQGPYDYNGEFQQLGIGQTVDDYHASICRCARMISFSLRGAGRCAIVIGDHENVPSSLWYEQALKENHMRLVAKLDRPYNVVKRGFAKDIIIIAEKVD